MYDPMKLVVRHWLDVLDSEKNGDYIFFDFIELNEFKWKIVYPNHHIRPNDETIHGLASPFMAISR